MMTDALFWSCLLCWPASGKGGAISEEPAEEDRHKHSTSLSGEGEMRGVGGQDKDYFPATTVIMCSQSLTWDTSDGWRWTKYKQRCEGSCWIIDYSWMTCGWKHVQIFKLGLTIKLRLCLYSFYSTYSIMVYYIWRWTASTKKGYKPVDMETPWGWNAELIKHQKEKLNIKMASGNKML